jgi:uncharacterized membrane protein
MYLGKHYLKGINMDVSGVNPEIAVKLQKSGDKQLEKVTSTLINSIDDSNQKSREFFNTGHNVNIQA